MSEYQNNNIFKDWDEKEEEMGYFLHTEYYGDNEEEELFSETSRAYEKLEDINYLISAVLQNKLNNPSIKLIRFWVGPNPYTNLVVYEARRNGEKFWQVIDTRQKNLK